MNKITIVVILVLFAGSFCFVNSINASSSASPATIGYKDINSSETTDYAPSYRNSEPESTQKHKNKILQLHVESLQDSENIIERPPAWATNLENDFSFSLKIKVPFM